MYMFRSMRSLDNNCNICVRPRRAPNPGTIVFLVGCSSKAQARAKLQAYNQADMYISNKMNL
uniref:Uncharacterized protein n=1 Tax=Setaria italica TaxID=4555 RepID=K3ZZ70_SETIT